VAAQDVYWEREGAFTGEVSPAMVKEAGAEYVIVGHSERRRLFGETDAIVNRKTAAAIGAALTPIVCIGETLEEREGGMTTERVTSQTRAAFEGVKASDVATCVVAYEPIWAIGTGRNATPQDANETILVIRTAIRELYGEATAQTVRIQYGGSVKPGNAADLMAQPEIDGALVGGASLDPDDFARIIQYRR
jgi:triosephosphate isomerase (TIM)